MALIPLPPPPPRHPWRRLAVTLGIIVVFVGLLMAIGEPLAELRDAQAHKAPGRAMKLPSATVHLFSGGQRGSLPTVVIDGDLGLPAAAWAELVHALSQKTLVVAWDRPGYGWSTLGSGAHDGLTLVHAYHQALTAQEQLGPFFQSQELPPPYVLVGQGLGTAHMRIFANEYPQEVVGMVLVDCLYPGPGAEALKRQKDDLSLESWKRRLFLRRLVPEDPPSWFSRVPGDLRGGAEAMWKRSDTPEAEAEELAALDQTLQQADQFRTFGEKPLQVLRSRGADETEFARCFKLDSELSRLSTQGNLQMLPAPATGDPMTQSGAILQAIHTAMGATD